MQCATYTTICSSPVWCEALRKQSQRTGGRGGENEGGGEGAGLWLNYFRFWVWLQQPDMALAPWEPHTILFHQMTQNPNFYSQKKKKKRQREMVHKQVQRELCSL